jgi:hypothetical protein
MDLLRGLDLNQRPLGYEPNELPDCSTPHFDTNSHGKIWSTLDDSSAKAAFLLNENRAMAHAPR